MIKHRHLRPSLWSTAGLLICAACARPVAPLGEPLRAQTLTAGEVRTGKEKRTGPGPLAPVYSKALAGDVREAISVLKRVAVDSMNSSERKERECLLATFAEKKLPPVQVGDPFVAELIGIYRDYWMRVLLQELSAPEGEQYLFERLTSLLGSGGHRANYDSLNELVEAVGSILLDKGFHSLRGVTKPYYELMVWGKESTKSYDVELPETRIAVKVVFMQDFAVLGWGALATCGKAYSGGWAKNDSLYCVADAYDTATEKFSVSYLAHESQHFADYKTFPKLQQPELEYRAKLVELSKAKKIAHPLVMRFTSQTGESRSAPHNYANLKVIADLSRSLFGGDAPVLDEQRWNSVSVADINRAATRLLQRNTEALLSLGAATVSEVLE